MRMEPRCAPSKLSDFYQISSQHIESQDIGPGAHRSDFKLSLAEIGVLLRLSILASPSRAGVHVQTFDPRKALSYNTAII